MINTNTKDITQEMLDAAEEIEILSGEGEDGQFEEYEGHRTVRAVRRALIAERCNGDRWSILVIDGERI